MSQVSSMEGGATMPPWMLFAANSGSVYTGLWSVNASHQCRIMGEFTSSGVIRVLLVIPTP